MIAMNIPPTIKEYQLKFMLLVILLNKLWLRIIWRRIMSTENKE